MNCHFCGSTNLQGKFCNECGNPLSAPPQVCKGCGNTELIGKFCHECGMSISGNSACPECNAPDQHGSFCKVCGKALKAETSEDGIPYELFIESEFDRGKAFCHNCGDFSAKYRLKGVLVEYCSLCGAGESFLDFEN